MIGHQQFDQRLARLLHSFRICADHHSWFGRAHARGGEDSGAHVNHANAADPNGFFILLVAKGGNCNVVQARGVEDTGPGRNRNFFPVDRQIDHRSRAHAGLSCARDSTRDVAAFLLQGQTPAGQRECSK